MPRFSLKQMLFGMAIVALGVAALISIYRLADPFDDVSFTPAAWAKRNSTERARMSRDLVRNHLPRGLSHSQVEALLGQGDNVIKPNDLDAWKVLGAEAHEYYIESFGEYGIDDACVRVHYDTSGKAIEAEITYH